MLLDNIIQDGETPLHTAAEYNKKKCMELLLSHGAEANIKNVVSNNDKMNWSVDDTNIIITIISFRMDGHHSIWLL